MAYQLRIGKVMYMCSSAKHFCGGFIALGCASFKGVRRLLSFLYKLAKSGVSSIWFSAVPADPDQCKYYPDHDYADWYLGWLGV